MNKKSRNTIIFILLALIGIVTLFPILFIFISSFRSRMDVTLYPSQLLPNKVTFDNYISILTNKNAPVVKWLLNSVFVSTTHTILTLIACSTAGFAFARMNFRFKNVIFLILLSSMMIPRIVNFIPLYKLMSDMKLVDTYAALIIPGIENAFNIFLIRQFMSGIPLTLDEASYIDGANAWQVYLKIILPLSKPVLFVVGLFSFRNNWNELLWPLVAVSSNEKRTITAGLSVVQGAFEHEFNLVNTVTVLSVIPLIIMFIFTQKYFMEGLSVSSGMKE